jgi:hypothetical protein
MADLEAEYPLGRELTEAEIAQIEEGGGHEATFYFEPKPDQSFTVQEASSTSPQESSQA